MTPFSSVAMLEKLALLKMALCSAPALRTASSARFLGVTSSAARTGGSLARPSVESAADPLAGASTVAASLRVGVGGMTRHLSRFDDFFVLFCEPYHAGVNRSLALASN